MDGALLSHLVLSFATMARRWPCSGTYQLQGLDLIDFSIPPKVTLFYFIPPSARERALEVFLWDRMMVCLGGGEGKAPVCWD